MKKLVTYKAPGIETTVCRRTLTLRIEPASLEDIPDLTLVMTKAFDADSLRHLGEPKDGPPGYDNGDFFRKWMPPKDSFTFKVLINDTVIAGIIVWVYDNGKNTVGTIFVNPEYSRLGIGSIMIRWIDKAFPNTKQWTLGTPSWALSNHSFYENNGYVKIKEVKEDNGASFIYRKVLSH